MRKQVFNLGVRVTRGRGGDRASGHGQEQGDDQGTAPHPPARPTVLAGQSMAITFGWNISCLRGHEIYPEKGLRDYGSKYISIIRRGVRNVSLSLQNSSACWVI